MKLIEAVQSATSSRGINFFHVYQQLGGYRSEASCREQWKRLNGHQISTTTTTTTSTSKKEKLTKNMNINSHQLPFTQIQSLNKAVKLSRDKETGAIDWISVYLYFNRQGTIQQYQDMWNIIQPKQNLNKEKRISIPRYGPQIEWSGTEVCVVLRILVLHCSNRLL